MIQVQFDGVSKELSPQQFLDLILRLAGNSCIIARAIYAYCKKPAFGELEKIHGFLPTVFEFEAIERVVVNKEIRSCIGMVTAKLYALRDIENGFLSIFTDSIETTQHIGPTRRGDKQRIKDWLSSMRGCIIEMQIAENELQEIVSKTRGTSNKNIFIVNISLEFSTPTSLPTLPNQKPFKYKLLSTEEAEQQQLNMRYR